MDTLYQRIGLGERSESTTIMIWSRGSLENEATELQSNKYDSPAAPETINSTTKEITSHQGKAILSRCLSTGHLLEWLIHFAAIGISIGICSLHFRQQYWTDESTLSKKWRWVSHVSLDLNDVIKALQFVAKAHEVLVVASIGAVVLYFARRRLVGRKGIALGLLMTSYRIDKPVNILSSQFWSALGFDASALEPETVVLGLLLLVSAILCQLVGPASAGVMQPSLDWWNVSDPYNGRILPLYLSARDGKTFPLVLDNNTWPLEIFYPLSGDWAAINATACLAEGSPSFCPARGFDAVQTWTQSNYEDHAPPNLTVTGTSGTQRTLTADVIANGTAIAATHSNWVIRMFGLFSMYIKNHPGIASSITYPRYTSNDPLRAPVVQVQCHAVLASENGTVDFVADKLTNYTESGARQYDATSWPVPDKVWNYHSKLQDGVNFTWVDFPRGHDNMWRPSLGAVAKVRGWVDGQLGFYTIPCIIDARWAASSAVYQPTLSDIVVSNLSSPAVLAPDASSASMSARARAYPRQQLGIGDAIQIGLDWANVLNAPGYSYAGKHDLTSIEAMLDTYIRRTEDSGSIYGGFTVGTTNGSFVNETAQLMQAAANTTATILSLTIADGLSRLSDGSWNMVVLDDTGNGNVSWTAIDFDFYPINSSEVEFMKQFTSIRVQVGRYGWAYGWSAVLIIDVVVLFMHVSMVVLYAGHYILLYFQDRWWMTTAWNNAAELLLLAWDSTPTAEFREAEETKSPLWAQNISVRERDGRDGDAMELVAGRPHTTSSGGLLKVGKKYM